MENTPVNKDQLFEKLLDEYLKEREKKPVQNRPASEARSKLESIDLLEIFFLFRSKLLYIAFCAILAGFLAFSYTSRYVAPMYQASIHMIVNARQDTHLTGNSVSDVTSAENLVATYAAVIKSNRVMEQVVKAMDLSMNWRSLNSMVSVRPLDNTPVIQIIATCPDPDMAREVVTTISRISPELIVDAVEAGSCKVISDADCTGSPISPNTRREAMKGAVVGAALCCGVIFLFFLMDNRIKNDTHLSQLAGSPVLSNIPISSQGKGRKGKKASTELLSDNTPFHVTESFVRLRTNFVFATLGGDRKKIVVTSCEANEGKSTTTLNLAISLAKSGKRVLVIDCDLRRSKLRHYTEHHSAKKGLSNILSNTATLQDCIFRDEALGFDILYSGETAPNPSELLSSENMRHLLDKLEGHYDYLLLDSPPMLAVSDAAILSDMADGVLFIVRHDKSDQRKLTLALQELRGAGAKILGCVLNMYNAKKDSSYYGRGYYYSSYYNSEYR